MNIVYNGIYQYIRVYTMFHTLSQDFEEDIVMQLCWMHTSRLSNKSPRREPDAAGMEEAIGKFLDGLEGQESCHLLKILHAFLYLYVQVCDLECVFSIGWKSQFDWMCSSWRQPLKPIKLEFESSLVNWQPWHLAVWSGSPNFSEGWCVRSVIHSTCQRNVFMASILRCANIHLVLQDMCVYTSIYSHVLRNCEQDTVVIVPTYPYCIEEDRLDVALEDCWYARPQHFFQVLFASKAWRIGRNILKVESQSE